MDWYVILCIGKVSVIAVQVNYGVISHRVITQLQLINIIIIIIIIIRRV